MAGTNFWGDIIGQIGGAHVTVTSIISDPNTDPHEYESDAKDAAAIANAQFVLENGFGYDDFMDKLLAASPNANREVLSVQTIPTQLTGADANPHIWYDTAGPAKWLRRSPTNSASSIPSGRCDVHRQRQHVR